MASVSGRHPRHAGGGFWAPPNRPAAFSTSSSTVSRENHVSDSHKARP